MLDLLWLLLPVAAASGWWMARHTSSRSGRGYPGRADYFRGLNYLLDDKPDEAIEVFARMARDDRDALETQLTLGSLFRRRGEVDRAIQLHRQLVDHDRISPQLRNRALLELGEDYTQAGLFDRAETLYRDLLDHPGQTAIGLSRLVDIYRQEKDWRRALDCCDRLAALRGEPRRVEAAHFCCELAEAHLCREDRVDAAIQILDEALERDPNCVRASMLLGRIAMDRRDYSRAIAEFQRVERQERSYFPEVIDALGHCYGLLDRRDDWLAYLRDVQSRDHSGRITAALADLLVERQGETTALAFLETELRTYPTVLGLRGFLDLKRRLNQGASSADLEALARISRHMLNESACYRCDNCGFLGRSLHWCCPSCRSWNTVKPIKDLLFREQN